MRDQDLGEGLAMTLHLQEVTIRLENKNGAVDVRLLPPDAQDPEGEVVSLKDAPPTP